MRIAPVRHMRIPLAIFAALAAVSLFGQTTLIEQGRAAISRGDSDAAIDILEKAVAQSPKNVAYTPTENEPPLANAHYYLGAIYEKEGRKAEAKLAYQAALKLNPTLKHASEALKRVS